MISVSVKGDKIVDHYGLISNSDFHPMWSPPGHSELGMGSSNTNSKSDLGGILSSHSHHDSAALIDEYDPNEEDDYDDEEEEDDEELDESHSSHNGHHNSGDNHHLLPLPTSTPASTSTSTPISKLPPSSREQDSSGSSELESPTHFLRFLRKLSNMTRDTGMDVKLGCEAEGYPAPRTIKWYKNGVLEQLRGDRFRIKHSKRKTSLGKKSPVRIVGSYLKIRKLEVLDKGFYTCEAVGGSSGAKISSTGILNVIHDPGLDSGVIPDFPSAFESFPEIGESGSIHHIGSFQRVPLLPPQTNGGVGREILYPLLLQPPKDGHGFCQPYRGTICRKYLENRTIYVSSEESQFLLESKLKETITLIKHAPDISEQCSTHGIPSLCHYAFPQCSNPPSITSPPRRLCREECEFLEESLCKEEYTLAKRHSHIGPQLLLPQCSSLPPVGEGGANSCLRLGLPQLQAVLHLPILDEAQPCYKDDGEEYRGPVRETVTGSRCRPWSSESEFKPANHPELLGGHRFCRNPGGREQGPWCYTQGKGQGRGERLVKEHCRVEQCGFFGYDDKLWLSLAGGLSALFLLLFCFAICCCCRRGRLRSSSKSKKSKNPASCSPTFLTLSDPLSGSIQHLEMNSLLKKIGGGGSSGGAPSVLNGFGNLHHGSHNGGGGSHNSHYGPASSSLSSQKHPEVPVNHVHLYEELGAGAFGKVYKGEALLRLGESPVRTVIKTLKGSASAKTRQDFFREVELMGELKHPNILCLVGVVTKEEPRCLLFEWMSQGDLHEFLISHSPRGDPALTEWILETNEMLFIATQIAAGMEYLAAHHYVHRDLAARNALVGDGLTVKISDFGLSREIYNSDYYRVQSKSLVPVRWMPPEAIMYGKFSTESDVFSFGIVLWEIYSYGLQPYFGFSNPEVVDIVRSRQLLPCPDLCPPRMYSIMVECWAELPHRRPSFEELHTRLKQWLLPLLGPNSNFSPHIHLGQNSNPNYPFAPPSTASNNSMSSAQSSNATGPLSNNTNSTSVSTQWPANNAANGNNPSQQQQQQQQLSRGQQVLHTFQGNNGNNGNGHCVAYQSTPIVHPNISNGNGGGFSPGLTQQPHPHQYQNATAHFHSGTGRISHQTHTGSGPHSPSPYRVFMESKSTNI